ncbi:MAG: hypothetical protein ACFNX9_00190 [Eikenella corrodens]|uniref:hypothetical protein n=1 Tax=Eikenella corrodens TaxID=539 RepID=UPI0036196C21
MFSLFKIKAKNIDEKLRLEIDELEKVLKLSKRLTDKQIDKLAKYLRRHPPAERYNLIYSDIQQALATDKTIPADFKVKLVQVEMRIANFRASEMIRRERSKEAGVAHVSISFLPEIKYCETAQEYRQKYDGKVIKLEDVPIFPLMTCYKCNCCTAHVFVKPLIKGLDY